MLNLLESYTVTNDMWVISVNENSEVNWERISGPTVNNTLGNKDIFQGKNN